MIVTPIKLLLPVIALSVSVVAGSLLVAVRRKAANAPPPVYYLRPRSSEEPFLYEEGFVLDKTGNERSRLTSRAASPSRREVSMSPGHVSSRGRASAVDEQGAVLSLSGQERVGDDDAARSPEARASRAGESSIVGWSGVGRRTSLYRIR